MSDLYFSKRYAKLCLSAGYRKIPNYLLIEDYIEIVKGHKCHYCSSELSITGYQVDRKDNNGTYSLKNCVPCCTTCNYKKGSKLTYDEMMLLSAKGIKEAETKKYYNGISVEMLDYDNTTKPSPSSPIHLSFYKNEFDKKRNVCLSIIAARAGLIPYKIGARSLELRTVPVEEAKVFLYENHIKGYSKAPAFGLYKNDQLLMLLSYKKFKTGEVEIHRLATKNFYVVQGGFSKLLKHVVKVTEPMLLFSFVDLRYHLGTGLIRIGFIPDSKISKSWHWTDGKQLFNRLRCRANMDDRRLSQQEHAKELGWWQLYDAGQQKFIKLIDKRKVKHSNYKTETWGQMESRLYSNGFKVNTTFEEYTLLERHKSLEVECLKSSHKFNRTRHRLWSLTDCPECEGRSRKSSFEECLSERKWEYESGTYEDKNSYLTCSCPKGHRLRRQYRWFRDNDCPKCAYENSTMLRRVSDALGGSPVERKRKVYEQILERCRQTDQILNTTWKEFLKVNKTSATIPIRITCKYKHTRNTIWQVAKEHKCGCSDCRKENKPSKSKRAKNPLIPNDIPFDDSGFKVGFKVGNLTVEEIIDAKNVICTCDCGESTITSKHKLIRRKVKSCGCKQWDKTENTIEEGTDTIEGVDDKLKSLSYKRIKGSVTSEDSRLLVECIKCTHEREMNWSMIKGTCKNCYHIEQTKKAYEKVVVEAKKHNYDITDSFEAYLKNCIKKTVTRNSLVKINSKCPNQHSAQVTSASASKRKWRCVECIRQLKGK